MKRNQVDPEAFLKRAYSRVLIPDAESGTFTAMILEFPGCVAQGSTPSEAYELLERAAESWISAAAELGQSIPEPHEENVFSGKFALRMPVGLHRGAAQAAEREGTSLNQFVVAAVAERVGATLLYAELASKLERRIHAPAYSSMEAMIKVLSHYTIEHTATTPPSMSTEYRLPCASTSEVN